MNSTNNSNNDIISFHCRNFSSSSSQNNNKRNTEQKGDNTSNAVASSSNNDNKNLLPSDDVDDFILFYQRDSSRNVAHQGFFAVSIFNTTYWMWYTFDFVPAVNSSPIADIHVDPRIGWGGIALGLFINALTVLYPLSSISRLGYSPNRHKWYLWGHSLPLLGPSTGNPKEYPLGDLSMDRTSTDTKKLLDSGINSFQGHLGIFVKDSKYPYLMEIKDNSTELPSGENTDMMLQALLNPGALLHTKRQKPSPNKKENTKKTNRRKRKKY